MPRKKSNLDYSRDKLEAEILKTVVEVYESENNKSHSVNFVAENLEISTLKARKLLITAGERAGDIKKYYSTELSDAVQRLYYEGSKNAESDRKGERDGGGVDNSGGRKAKNGKSNSSLVQYCINNGELYCQRYPSICPFKWMRCKVILFYKTADAFFKFFY